MEPLQSKSDSASLTKARNWSVKSTKGKVICESQVEIKADERVESPIFWHSDSTEWQMRLYRSWGWKTTYLMVSFKFLSSENDQPVEGELKASAMWEGAEAEIHTTETVALDEPQEFNLILEIPEDVDKFLIRGEVRVPPDTSDLHQNTPLHRDLCSLSNDLGTLLDSGKLSDVVLCAGDTELKAHRALLSARSPVFAAMLNHNNGESHRDKFHIEDVGPDTLQKVLHYIYTGRALGVEDIPDQLLVAADKYGLVGLKELCQQQLVSGLTVDNAAAFGVIALRHSCDLLKRAAICFIKKNLVPVLGSDGWAAATREHAEVIVEMTRLIADESAE